VTSGQQGAERRALSVGRLSLGANVALTAAKLLVGALSGSSAVVADGLHNGADAISSAVAWLALRAGARPADHDHPYGHARLETAAALLTGLILVGLAVEQGLVAGAHLLRPPAGRPDAWAEAVSLASMAAKAVLYAVTRRALRAAAAPSPALGAQAADHLMDILSSAVAAVAVALSLAGIRAADDWGTLAIAVLIAWVGLDIGRRTVDDLTDRYTDQASLGVYRQVVARVPGVLSVQRLRARSMGAYTWVDADVTADAALSFAQAHALSHAVQVRLEAEPTVVGSSVHVIPAQLPDPPCRPE
jgi:cation diffusion facilitator family transporter